MADFDPDKYLAETSVDKNEFNPDAYLAEGEKKKDVSPSKSVGGTSKSMAEAMGFEAHSTSEEKIKVPYVNQIKQSNIVKHDLNKSMTLKQGMAKDLISNPSSTYKDSYIKTLKNQGYDEAALTDWANSVEENKKTLEDNSAKLNSNPSDFDASYKTGIALLNLGNPDDAINMFNSTIANLPKSEEGTAQGIPVQNELAMNTPYKKAGSTNVANSFVGIGAALVQKKQYKDAVSYYEEALKNDPSSKEAHDGLAYAKYFLGDKEGSKVNQKESAKIAEENKKYEALGTQLGEETKQEVQQQKRSEEIGGIHDMLQSFATGYDPENKLGAIGWLNPIGKITSQIQRGALNGTQTINEGMQELSESQGDASKSIHGLVTAGTGVIETLFSTIPAAIAFNAGIDVIKQTVAKVPNLEWIGDAIDIPMTGLKTLATKLGIAPDEKSTLGQLVNAYDLVLGGVLLHEAPKIKGKIIDGLESYKDALKMAADGELNQKEMDELKTYSGKINDNITINDIKDNAEKPLAKKIEAKIEAAPSKQAEAVLPLDKLQTELAEMQSAFEKLPEGETKDILAQQIDSKEQEIAATNISEADAHLTEAKLNADVALTEENLTGRIERLQEDKKNVPANNKSFHDIVDKQINELTQQRDALQKQSTTGVLPREQNEARVAGGERVGMGQGEQGTAPTEKGKQAEVKAEEITPVEKSKYNTLKLKEAHGTLKENEKAQLEELKAKAGQKEVIEKTKAQIDNVVAALKDVSPDLKVETHETPEAFGKAAEDAGANAQESMVAGGFYDKATKTIHLNLENIKSNTLFHEGVHPILNVIHAADPKAVDRLFNQVVEAEKRAGKEGFYSKEFASSYDEAQQKMEAVTEFIADVADGKIKVTERNFDKIKQIFVDMMKIVGVDLSGKIKTVGELKALADKISAGFEKGEAIDMKSDYVDANGKPLTNKRIQFSINNDFSDVKSKTTFTYLKNSKKFEDLKKEGIITEDKKLKDFNGKYIFLHSPDGAFTGDIMKNGEKLVEGKGGMLYPIKFHDDGYFWASTKGGANSMVKQLNESARLNGGKAYMALTSAPADKLLSSTTAANGVLDIFTSKVLDKSVGIGEGDVKSAIVKAAKSRVVINEKNVGLGLKVDAKQSLEDIKNAVKEKLSPDNSTFADRKHFVEQVIANVVDNIKGKKSEQKLAEFLHLGISNTEMKGIFKEGYKLSKANVVSAISHMLQEPLLRGDKKAGSVYAILELDAKDINGEVVEAIESGKHESYPIAIRAKDGVSKTKLHILQDRNAWNENFNDPKTGTTVTKERELNIFPTSGVSTSPLQLMVKGEPSFQMQKPRQEITSLNVNGKDVKVKETQPDVVNGFYSPLEKVIADSKFDKLPVKQWIEKFAKGEEAKWTGLTDWLSKQEGSVSKADIQQYLKDNRVSVVEVVKGGEKYDDKLASLYKKYDVDSMSRLMNVATKEDIADLDRLYEGENNQTKFSDYQLEGEKNDYKEVLVTIPSKAEKVQNLTPNDIKLIATKGSRDAWRNVQVIFPDGSEKILFNTSLSDSQIKENAIQLQSTIDKSVAKRNSDFKSSHFDEPNILVHLRMNTRTDAKGNKVLFLEEVQSDWGQTGKKEGFENIEGQELAANKRSLINQYEDLYDLKGEKRTLDVVKKMSDILDDIKVINKKIGLEEDDYKTVPLFHKNTPQAPFVTDTNAWTKLGLKVALKEAVKQGADKIAWTTGDQQNARYDLSKSVSEIGYTNNGDGTYGITVLSKGSRNIILNEKDATLSFIESNLGKDIAKKIEGGEGEVEGSITSIKDDNLKVGGKGMKGFYGSPKEGSLGIVGNVAKSLFKQEPKTVELNQSPSFVKEKLEVVYRPNEPMGRVWLVEDNQGRVIGRLSSKEAAEQEMAGMLKKREAAMKTSTQHSIDITPELKASVSQGQPLFQKPRVQFSKGEEELSTVFSNAEATAKSHSIEKGLQELESSDYYKKQPKESQQELTEYFKERVGAEEKGTTIDKFNALDKIAEEFKKDNVTKEFRNQRKAIFEENPEIEHIEKNFSKITKQLEENKDFKKSSPECP
jgi:tetratricopeptide (TPR) repeat protein